MTKTLYAHLGSFGDLVEVAKAQKPLFPVAPPGEKTQRSAWEVFGFTAHGEQPMDARLERSWRADGVDGEEVSWSVGFGPRRHAWILKPAQARGPLPGIVALHDHGHYKMNGKEKIADGPDGPLPALELFRQTYYGGRGYANQLAREGFVVLAHDAFLWGSRKFPARRDDGHGPPAREAGRGRPWRGGIVRGRRLLQRRRLFARAHYREVLRFAWDEHHRGGRL